MLDAIPRPAVHNDRINSDLGRLSYLQNPDPGLNRGGWLHSLFEASAARHGECPALECQGETLSYRELEAQANRCAAYLRAHGIRPGDRVGLLLGKSPELYWTMLGILKAGAAYVPLDPSYPAERVGFILEDCRAALLITSLDYFDLAGSVDTPKLFINEARHAIAEQSAEAQAAGCSPHQEAYLIYTSGTTGRPKGVPVPHGNAYHLVQAEQRLYGIRPEDRVLQGFSLAFDASVEEIWTAFAAGATLVAGTPDVMLAGPDLGRRLEELRISVLSCVPTLLAMLPQSVPTVRLLILGGETLPAKFVEPWYAPSRRIYNTYGPTETTVVATAGLCQPGAPVTIGQPLANYTIYIMDESGKLLERGREGELVIGGYGVTGGYLNRDELTQRQFVANRYAELTGDASPTLYRTGDLAKIDAAGEVHYLGRIDTQVKIRGFRVELAEIETLLLALPGIRNAAAALQEIDGRPLLAAYVVAADGASFDEADALAQLKQKLPPYMLPAFIQPLPALPTLASGKIDRKALPPPDHSRLPAPKTNFATPLQLTIHNHWCRLFGNEAIGADEDFFLDLGGHSLLAAAFVSAMRQDARYAQLAMGDLYAHPTIATLAAHLEQASAEPAAVPADGTPSFFRIPAWQYRLSGLFQAGILYSVIGFFALQWVTPFMVYSFYKAYEAPFWESLGAAFLSLAVVYPAMLLLGVAAKWLIIGRLKEGDYPIWGWYYLRWLWVQRLLRCLPLQFLAGTPLLPWYLRLLGARIGKNVFSESHLIAGLDLLSIGDDACINADANISCYSLEDGLLKIRRVDIGRGVGIGIRSVIGPDVAIGDGSVVDDHSCIAGGQRLGSNEYWSGSPARRLPQPPQEERQMVDTKPHPLRDALSWLFFSACFFVLPALALLPIFPGIVLMYHFDYASEDYAYLLLSPLVALIFVVLTALQTMACKWLLLGRLRAGVYAVNSGFYKRKWVVDKLMASSLDMLRTLYATLYLNPWYRALGVQVGRHAEISTAAFILPDLLHIGAGSFIADGAALGPAKASGGHIILKRTEIGARSFIGNNAYVPVGAHIGENCLLGCQTSPPGPITPDGTSWVGTPALNLRHRQEPERQFAEERTYRPTRWLYAQRLFIEFFRVILPATAFVVFTTLMLSFSIQIEDNYGPLATVAVFPLLYILLGIAAMLLAAALKWLLIGRYRTDEQPLWSPFVWLTELVTGFYEHFTGEFFTLHLQGTQFLPWYLRLLGMSIGKRACIMTTDFTEFDLVRIGDDVALNEDCTIQTHLFEDRVMKMAGIHIGSRVSIGSYTVVLYDTVIEDDVKIGDLSLLMKGERLYAGSQWAGAPVQPNSAFGRPI